MKIALLCVARSVWCVAAIAMRDKKTNPTFFSLFFLCVRLLCVVCDQSIARHFSLSTISQLNGGIAATRVDGAIELAHII